VRFSLGHRAHRAADDPPDEATVNPSLYFLLVKVQSNPPARIDSW